jgi:hypothetical protein
MGRKKYQGQFRGGNGTHEKVSLTPFFRLRPALISHVVGVSPTPIFPQKKREARRASHHEFISATGACGKARRVT